MTDTEPTPPARPEGQRDDTAAVPSPWASDTQPLARPVAQHLPPGAPQPWAARETSWDRPAPYGGVGWPAQPGGAQPGGAQPGASGLGGQPPQAPPPPGWSGQPGWTHQPSGQGQVDTLGRARRHRRGGAGFVALVVALSLLAGLVGGVLGSVLTERTDLVGGSPADRAAGGDGSASAARDEPDAAPPMPDGRTGSVAEIAAQVLPSVVSISVTTGQGNGTGSGFVIDDEGLIVTNNHVIAAGGDVPADDIVVELSDGSQAPAQVVGTDASYDIAVLRVDPSDTGGLTELPFGDSDRVVVGEQVVAVGAPLGLDATVTTGIVSALNRPVSAGGGTQQAFINAIQTDAAINPGNSGGPLVNMRGEVVGVNSAIAQAPGGRAGGSIGLGFSIPSNQADRTAGQLIEDGVATYPVVGVLLDRQYSGEGVRIVTAEDAEADPPVTPGGPADAAGLRAGDVILAFDGRPMTDSDELVVAIRAREPGDEVTLTVRRDDEVFDVSLVLEAGDQG